METHGKMKISELKENKTTRRATRNFDSEGRRIYEFFEYEIPYDTSYEKNRRDRFCSKIIDMIPFTLLFVFILHKPLIFAVILSIPCAIVLGSVTEHFFGCTLGKKIFKIKVIDDYGNYPNILKSFARNLLCLANLFFFWINYEHPENESSNKSMRMDFHMHFNNEICKTYIVKEIKMEEIRKLLHNRFSLNKK